MKKMLLVAALCMFGNFAFANSQEMTLVDKATSQVSFVGGWCEIRIYDSNGVLIRYSYSYESSEAVCKAKAFKMMEEESGPLN